MSITGKRAFISKIRRNKTDSMHEVYRYLVASANLEIYLGMEEKEENSYARISQELAISELGQSH